MYDYIKILMVCIHFCNARDSMHSEEKGSNHKLKINIDKILMKNIFHNLIILYDSGSSYEEISEVFKLEIVPRMVLQINENNVENAVKLLNQSDPGNEDRFYTISVQETKDATQFLNWFTRLRFYRARDKILMVVKSLNPGSDLRKIFFSCSLYSPYILLVVSSYAYSCDLQNNIIRQRAENSSFVNRLTNLDNYSLNLTIVSGPVYTAKTKKNKYISRDELSWQEIVKRLNARAVFRTITDRYKRFNEEDDAFADTVHGLTDASINSRVPKIYFFSLVDVTYPHDHEDVVFVVPKASLTNILLLLKPFTVVIWALVVVVTIILGFLWHVATGHQSFALTDSIAGILGYSISVKRSQIKLSWCRYILLLQLVHATFLSNAYRSALSGVLSVSLRGTEIDTFDQLEQSNLPIYGSQIHKDMLLKVTGKTLTSSLLNRTQVLEIKALTKLIQSHRQCAVIYTETLTEQILAADSETSFRIMRRHPLPSYVCYVLRYGSPLTPRINSLLLQMQEAGLQRLWKRYTLRYLLQTNSERSHTNEPRIIHLSDMTSVCIILISGWFSSVIVFVAECLLYKYKNRRVRQSSH